MSENALPSNWELDKFNTVIRNIVDNRGKTPPIIAEGIELLEVNSITKHSVGPVYSKVSKFVSNETFEKWFRAHPRKGDILIPTVGTIGVAVLMKEERGTIAQNIVALQISNEHDSEYWYYYVCSEKFLEDVMRVLMVAIQPSLKVPHMRNFLVPIPPLAQQQKIAKILSTVDNLIEKTQTLIDKYTAIKQGMMADLFTRGIDMTTGDTPNSKGGKLRPSIEDAPELYKQTELGWVPKEWEVEYLGDIAAISSGITLGNEYSGSDAVEVAYLRVANVQDGYLDLSEVKTVKIPPSNVSKYLLEIGDVLMNEGGDFDKLGRGTIWGGEVENCCHQNHVFKVRAHRSTLLPEYLAYWSASSFGKSYFIINSKQSTNLASINSSQLKKFPVLVPSLDEQEKILGKLRTIDGNISNLELDIDKNKRIKKGLMQDLLTGKVQVSLDSRKN